MAMVAFFYPRLAPSVQLGWVVRSVVVLPAASAVGSGWDGWCAEVALWWKLTGPVKEYGEMAKKKKKSGSSIMRMLFGLLLVSGAAVIAGPTIVAKTSLRQQIAAWIAPDFQGRVLSESASYGWFSQTEMSGVTVVGADGQTLLTADKLYCDRNVWQLYREGNNLGVVGLLNPKVHIALRDKGSNWEDALGEMLTKPASGKPMVGKFAVSGGVVTIASQQQKWTAADIEATLTLPGTPTQPLTSRLSTFVHSGDTPPPATAATTPPAATPPAATPAGGAPAGSGATTAPAAETAVKRAPNVEAEISWIAGEGIGQGHAVLKADRLPLEMISPLLQRAGVNATAAGPLTSNCRLEWDQTGGRRLQIAQLSTTNLVVQAPEWLGPQVARVAYFNATGDVSMEAGRADFQRLKVDSSLGVIEATGSMPVTTFDTAAAIEYLKSEDYTLQGRLDLAQLAAAFPDVLHIRDGVQLKSGQVTVNVNSAAAAGGLRRWVAVLESTQIAAEHNGQYYAWDQPVRVAVTAQQTAAGPVIEDVQCASTFMRLGGKGSLQQGNLSGEINLSQLSTELARFIDLQSIRLEGQTQAQVTWNQDQQRSISLTGNASVSDWMVQLPGARPWKEKQLTAVVNARAIAGQMQVDRVDAAVLRIQSGNDVLETSLTAPVDLPKLASIYPLRVSASGSLETWLPRMQVFAPLAGWQLAGGATLAANLSASITKVDIADATLTVDQFTAATAGLKIVEPRVEVSGAAAYDFARNQLSSSGATLTSSSVSLRANSLLVEMQPPVISGELAYRASLQRVLQWAPSATPRTWDVGGVVAGNMTMSQRAGVTTATTNAEIENLVYATYEPPAAAAGIAQVANASPWKAVWSEPLIRIETQAQYHHADDVLQLLKANVTSPALSVHAAGRITSPATAADADLRGNVNYDLRQIATRLSPALGAQFTMQGDGMRPFVIRGPLFKSATSAAPAPASSGAGMFHNDLTAEFSVACDGATAYGLTAGAFTVDAKLARNVVNISPLNIPVSEGFVRSTPQVDLSSAQPVLNLPAGRVIENVAISPEMCATWLKYVAPLAADATRAQGRFSLELDKPLSMPLQQVSAATLAGKLNIHSGAIGPGPLGQQVLATGRQVISIARKGALATGDSNTQVTLPPQVVPFQMVAGRVHHQQLTMQVADMVIRTSGSAGFDQTLAMNTEVPIQDAWLGSDAIAQTLRGKTITIPVRGTFSRPQIDNQVIKNLGGEMLRGGANSLIEKGIQSGLKGLFGN